MFYNDQFIDYLRFQKRSSIYTIQSYETDLNQFIDFCHSIDKTINSPEIDYRIIRKWIIELLDNEISARSVNRKISTLKSYFKFLIKEGYVAKSPLNKILSSKTKKKLPAFVEENQFLELFDIIEFEAGYMGQRNKMIMDLFYRTGIRKSELINLKDKDVDIKNMTIKVHGKRDKERLIPFTRQFIRQIQEFRATRDLEYPQHHEFFFVGSKGTKLYDKEVYRIVHKYLSLVTSITKKSPHVIRHTFATHMLNHGADLNAIKEILGHANLAATQVYTHNSFEKLKSVYKKAHPRA